MANGAITVANTNFGHKRKYKDVSQGPRYPCRL